MSVATAEAVAGQTQIAELTELLEAAARERDDLRIDLDICKDSLTESVQKLEAAQGAIVALSEVEVRDAVADMTESMVEAFPELSEHADLLAVCESAEEVATQSTAFLISRSIPAEPAPAPIIEAVTVARRTLPKGLIVESDLDTPARPEPKKVAPAAVSLAAAALRKMKAPV